MASDIIAAVLAEASRAILEKVKSGKKLAPEEITILMIDLVYGELRDLRREVREGYVAINRRIDELNKRVDELNKRMDEVYRELGRRIDEVNRRIDEIYRVLATR